MIKEKKEENQNQIQNNEKEYNIVLYTDGSCKYGEYRGRFVNSSVGSVGSSYIGYAYDRSTLGEVSKNLPKDVIISNLGFMNQDLIQQDPVFYRDYKTVKPSHYYIGVIPSEIAETNNVAEVRAALEALRAVKKSREVLKNINLVFLKSDSNMMVQVLDRIINDPNVDITNYAFPDMYKEIKSHIEDIHQHGGKFIVKHVYGHSNSFGNILADRLAYLARCKANTLRDEIKVIREFIPVNQDKNEFWVKYEDERFPMGNNLYFLKGHELGDSAYVILNYPKDKEVGEKNGEVLMGVMIREKNSPIVDDVFDRTLKYEEDNACAYGLDLRNLKNYMTNFFYRLLGKDVFRKDNKPGNLTLAELFPIVRPIKPGGLLVQLTNKMVRQKYIMSEFEEGRSTDFLKFTDISGLFFEIPPKKSKTNFICTVGQKDTHVIVNVNGVEIKLAYKLDIPERSFFKNMEKCKNIVVTLVTHEVSPGAFDYFTIINGEYDDTSKNFKSMWGNYYSNKVYRKN